MELQDILKAINEYYKDKYSDREGWFIGRLYFEPQAIKLYKKCIVEIYYHVKNKNTLFVKQEYTDRAIQGEENSLKVKTLTLALKEILNKKEELDNYGI